MTSARFSQIGLDRLVHLAWMEKVSSLVLAGNDPQNIKAILQNDFIGSFRSAKTDVRGSLDKTITILLKVWLTSPIELEPLRIEGLELLRRVPRHGHLAIHWGMVMAVYPFWSSVAVQVGRLVRLQGSAASVHVQRRIREQYGERETVSRRTRYVLRSYLDWGVVQETGTKGIYTAGTTHAVDDSRLIAWLAEASLHSRLNGAAAIRDLLETPSLFPFQFRPVSAKDLLSASSRLECLRHGLDDDLVMLRKQKTTMTKAGRVGS